LVDRTRSKHTSQNRPSFCAFYWVTTFSSAKRVSGWPKGRNFGGVTGELRTPGLNSTKGKVLCHYDPKLYTLNPWVLDHGPWILDPKATHIPAATLPCASNHVFTFTCSPQRGYLVRLRVEGGGLRNQGSEFWVQVHGGGG
jgi:hypothetical protein